MLVLLINRAIIAQSTHTHFSCKCNDLKLVWHTKAHTIKVNIISRSDPKWHYFRYKNRYLLWALSSAPIIDLYNQKLCIKRIKSLYLGCKWDPRMILEKVLDLFWFFLIMFYRSIMTADDQALTKSGILISM